MTIFYSASRMGFFDSDIHAPQQIPGDAVAITAAEHQALLAAQSSGKEITSDAQGYPVAVAKTYTLDEIREQKLASLALYRWQKETEGITIGGVGIKTDRESQSLLNGALKLFDLNPTLQAIDWKGETGWVQVDKATLEAVGVAVGAHVQACFTREKQHATAIEALETIEEIEAYDITTGWPG
jgi:hypothetical protein